MMSRRFFLTTTLRAAANHQRRSYVLHRLGHKSSRRSDILNIQQQRFLSHDDETIVEAQVVREKPFRTLLKQEQEEQAQLEQDLKNALERYQSLLDKDSTEIPSALNDLRDCYEHLMYWDDALRVERVMQDYIISDEDRAASLYRQGKLYMRLQQVEKAHRYYQQAIDLYETVLPNLYHAHKGNILISMAGIHFHREKLPESLDILLQAEPHFRRHELEVTTATKDLDIPHVDLVKCLQHQGLLHRAMQDFQSALQKYEQALQVLELVDINDYDNKRQGLLMDQADMLSALDELDRALLVYQSILDQDRWRNKNNNSNQPTALEGVMLHNMGKIHAQQGQHELAVQRLSSAIDIKTRFVGEFSPEIAKSVSALGAVHAVVQNKHQALQCFQQALLIARMHSQDGDRDPQVLLALRNIALIKGDNVPKWNSDD